MMSPLPDITVVDTSQELPRMEHETKDPTSRPNNPAALVLESWAGGFLVGALIIMSCVTIVNMKKGVLLHKLILLELVLGYWQAFNFFWTKPVYGWWLSTAAVFLHISTGLHNVIAWMKLKPFMGKTSSDIFIGTVMLVQPYWIVEMYATFAFFNGINENMFTKTRPLETLFRDPWWVATCIKLVWVISRHYEMTLFHIVKASPRFGIMLVAMLLSVAFIIADILAVTTTIFDRALPIGVNPFWKLALVFKCLTDTVILDDFKTALDRLWAFKMSSLSTFGEMDSLERQTQEQQGIQRQNVRKSSSVEQRAPEDKSWRSSSR